MKIEKVTLIFSVLSIGITCGLSYLLFNAPNQPDDTYRLSNNHYQQFQYNVVTSSTEHGLTQHPVLDIMQGKSKLLTIPIGDKLGMVSKENANRLTTSDALAQNLKLIQGTTLKPREKNLLSSVLTNQHKIRHNNIAYIIQQYPTVIAWARFILLYVSFFIAIPCIWSSLFHLAIPNPFRGQSKEARNKQTSECLHFLLLQFAFASLLFLCTTPNGLLYTWYLLPILILVQTMIVILDWILSKKLIRYSNISPGVLRAKGLSSYYSHGFLCFTLIAFINVSLSKIMPIYDPQMSDISDLYRVNLSTYSAFLSLVFIVMVITRFTIFTFKDKSFDFNIHALYPGIILTLLFFWYLG